MAPRRGVKARPGMVTQRTGITSQRAAKRRHSLATQCYAAQGGGEAGRFLAQLCAAAQGGARQRHREVQYGQGKAWHHAVRQREGWATHSGAAQWQREAEPFKANRSKGVVPCLFLFQAKQSKGIAVLCAAAAERSEAQQRESVQRQCLVQRGTVAQRQFANECGLIAASGQRPPPTVVRA